MSQLPLLSDALPEARVIHADCRDAMREMDAESVSAIVCDPPYGLSFMGKGWDHGVPGVEFWTEALRVAKPGAHLVAFGGTRTFHRLACAIEDAGWEVRDCLSWLYGSGFPKSLDVSKAIDKAAGAERDVVGTRDRYRDGCERQNLGATGGEFLGLPNGVAAITAPATDAARQWQGWGTALKPAWEPIILARKPLTGTVAANVTAHGTGALNIDGCRIEGAPQVPGSANIKDAPSQWWNSSAARRAAAYIANPPSGRWPANVALGCACEGEHDEGCAVRMLDEQTGTLTSGSGIKGKRSKVNTYGNPTQDLVTDWTGDSGGASRFFCTAKASRRERGEGNTHPTVKPIALMRWLVRLVTPPGGLVLDPFAGSGSTLLAARAEGFASVGVEREAGYVEIIRRRLSAVAVD